MLKRAPLRRHRRTCAAEGCDRDFATYPSVNQRYCSRSCAARSRPAQPPSANAARRTAMRRRTGKANPAYRHGRRTGSNLRGWSVAVKGETKCRVCPAAAVDLHHAIPRSVCPPAAKRDLRNGLPLCKTCHTRWHRRTLVITRDVFTDDEWAYLTSLELTGRETAAWHDDHYPTTEGDRP